jgi:drug/metabolite transporter (DMT)-like permease
MYASIFSSIEPVITVIASGLILSEKVDYIQISGMALILISIMLPQIKKIEFANYEQKIT